MAIIMVFSGMQGFSGSIDYLLLRWKGSTIYTGSIYWIRLRSLALFKYLTTYLKGD